MQAAAHVWASGLFCHFIFLKKNSHLKGYIFHFNTPQVNLISDWPLNWPWVVEFEHHWGTGT